MNEQEIKLVIIQKGQDITVERFTRISEDEEWAPVKTTSFQDVQQVSTLLRRSMMVEHRNFRAKERPDAYRR